MNRWTSYLCGVCALVTPAMTNAAVLLEYRFNSPGTAQTSTGTNTAVGNIEGAATLGAAGSGLTGDVGDFAYLNTAPTAMGAAADDASDDGVFNASSAGSFAGLTEMTLVLWYKTDSTTPISDGARLVDYGNGFLVQGDSATGRAQFQNNGTGQSSGSGNYADTESWTFFAVTWQDDGDGLTGDTIYYRGTTAGDDASVVSNRSNNSNYADAILNNPSNALRFGNNGALNRPFDGYLDNIRLFDTVLSQEDLRDLQDFDLDSINVPEPTSAMLVGVGAWLAWGRRRGA